MGIKLRSLVFFGFIALAGCETTAPRHMMTPLEIQSMQTREYEQPVAVVFPSVISVFQDLGYTVKAADKSTGLIHAEGISQSDKAQKFWFGITRVSRSNATAFIERIGGKTRVRLSFVTTIKESTSTGQNDQEDTPVLDASVYVNAFDRIENAIFVRTSS